MTPPLFRATPLPQIGATLHLDGTEGRHAASALRLRVGEIVLVGDGRGRIARCTVTGTDRSSVTTEVLELVHHRPPSCPVTVVQALPKAERGELAVELATEAGADRIVPWQAERCVARWTGAKLDKGHAKWTNAARAAAKQSRRAYEPEIAEPVDRSGLIDLVGREVEAGARVLALHEQGAVPLAEALGDRTEPPARVVLVVGPEGGISDTELAGLQAAGAVTTVLGPEVLRTSTAAAVALGALGVLTERWQRPATTLAGEPTARPTSME